MGLQRKEIYLKEQQKNNLSKNNNVNIASYAKVQRFSPTWFNLLYQILLSDGELLAQALRSLLEKWNLRYIVTYILKSLLNFYPTQKQSNSQKGYFLRNNGCFQSNAALSHLWFLRKHPVFNSLAFSVHSQWYSWYPTFYCAALCNIQNAMELQWSSGTSLPS